MTLQKLQEPLQQAVQEKTVSHCKEYALMVHDWSRLTLANTRASWITTQSAIKPMLFMLCKAHLMSDKNRLPLAPVAQRGSYASDENDELKPKVASHLDEDSLFRAASVCQPVDTYY
ncbi:MAG: hypothetical protein NTW85_01605 [Methylococcales bacterium]|nr:hypothetical protein [Methylococcales bacterium]